LEGGFVSLGSWWKHEHTHSWLPSFGEGFGGVCPNGIFAHFGQGSLSSSEDLPPILIGFDGWRVVGRPGLPKGIELGPIFNEEGGFTMIGLNFELGTYVPFTPVERTCLVFLVKYQLSARSNFLNQVRIHPSFAGLKIDKTKEIENSEVLNNFSGIGATKGLRFFH
jgi:hypothetical protein